MKRRTLDLMFSLGGVLIAVLLAVAGVVLSANARFAEDYVATQLAQQNITFKPLDTLTDEERRSPGLVEYAGQRLTTGKQAEVYANEFIGLHLKSIAGGRTYADLGEPQTALRAQVTQAQQAGAANLAELQQQLADVTAQRETVFKGETLRGLLLTTYGFSEFGVKAGQAALVAYAAAVLLALLAAAGLVHAWMTPRTRAFAPVEQATREPAGV
ncbi:hypothetical protein [Catellatospora citrea]|uniref:Uncharacterized protein n=1 Tax=Catellatospora citrea TaxID=53366 RepID=A0A8J3NZB3_9ACTN|nr:hypothetical protein [Catellatospora citrea]RKE05939.1 hypothetical protein C8E86_0753 [Catellatospora citrea]GIF97601.1 hypothetical protein Cci01nite_26950 [Catellatospora citrea]